MGRRPAGGPSRRTRAGWTVDRDDESVDMHLGVHDRCVTEDEHQQRLGMLEQMLKQLKAD
jgi:hypothetical protein